jgi:hypothetical protein
MAHITNWEEAPDLMPEKDFKSFQFEEIGRPRGRLFGVTAASGIGVA